MIVRVALSCNIAEPLSYQWTGPQAEAWIGRRVVVPLANRLESGWIVDHDPAYRGRVKPVLGVITSGFRPSAGEMELARRVAEHDFVSMGAVLDHTLSPKQKSLKSYAFLRDGKAVKIAALTPAELQQAAAAGPLPLFTGKNPPAAEPPECAAQPGTGFRHEVLLSFDRDEVFRRRAAECLQQGRSVLLVVPEKASAARWQTLEPGLIAYTSELRPAERERLWEELRRGGGRFVCGGLSALFLPLPDLGLILVDRAVAAPYRSFRTAEAQLLQLARWKAEIGGIPLLEGGPTYTIDTYARRDVLTISEGRPAQPPPCRVVALKRGERSVPADLAEEARRCVATGRRALFLVNRKAAGEYLYCAQCKHINRCPQCGGTLRNEGEYSVACPQCSFRHADYRQCRRCGREMQLVPDLSLASLTAALGAVVGAHNVAVMPEEGTIPAEDAPLLFTGTPAAVHPRHRGRFSAVYAVRPEGRFDMNEPQTAEMIFSTLAELRELVQPDGEVVLYTPYHFHYALQLANDEEAFFQREMKYREWFRLPPVSPVFLLQVSDRGLRPLAAAMREIRRAHGQALDIRRIHLQSREKIKGYYRGVLEAHCTPQALRAAGLHLRRGLQIHPLR